MVFDRSLRSIDKYGRMHIERSNISKAAVNPYYGREIPDYQDHGLDPDRVYQLFRDPDELGKAATTFSRMPILSRHIPVSSASLPKEFIVGAVGSDIEFKPPYLVADLCIWEDDAIAGIDNEITHELSCAYGFDVIMEPGEFEGQAYDGRMTKIQGNHLTLVERGRAGSDVIVADRDPFGDILMKMKPVSKLLMAALAIASPKIAMDSKIPALAATVGLKDFDRKGFCDQVIACDEDLDPQKVDNLIDSILGVEQQDNPAPSEPIQEQQKTEAADESPEDKMRALLAGKVDDETLNAACALLTPATLSNDEGQDQEDKGMKPDEVKTAMDSAIAKSNAALRKQLLDAAEAARDVRQVIGDVVMDSAEDVYAMALDHLNIDHKGVTGTAALRALFKVANGAKGAIKVPVVAQDAAGMLDRFPAANRFRLA